MNTDCRLGDPRSVTSLGLRLSNLSGIRKYDTGAYSESQTLARTFAELEESFRKYLDDQLPRLLDPDAEADELFELLIDIGENYRHIIYHILDPRFYKHLFPLREDPE